MFKQAILGFLLSTSALAEYQTMVIQPKFIVLHMNQNRGIRINTNLIRYYQEYYPYDDLYFKGEIFLTDGTRIPVQETTDDIDLMLQDEVSKKKKAVK
jgi:hypothetical protein